MRDFLFEPKSQRDVPDIKANSDIAGCGRTGDREKLTRSDQSRHKDEMEDICEEEKRKSEMLNEKTSVGQYDGVRF